MLNFLLFYLLLFSQTNQETEKQKKTKIPVVNTEKPHETKLDKPVYSKDEYDFFSEITVTSDKKPVQHEQNTKKTLTILFAADTFGKFISSDCTSKHSDESDFLKLKLLIRKKIVNAEERNKIPPVVILGGNLISPDAFGNYIFQTDKRADWGVKLISAASPDVTGIGLFDLGNSFYRYAEAGKRKKLNLLASNLEFHKNKNEIIKFRQYLIIKRNGLKIAVLSLINPELAKTLPAGIRKKTKISDYMKTYRKIRKKLMKINPDFTILISHLDKSSGFPSSNLKFLRKLKENERPGLILAVSAYNPDFSRNSYISEIKSSDFPLIVGSSINASSAAEIKIDFKHVNKNFFPLKNSIKIKRLKPETVILPLREKRRIFSMKKKYCEKYGKQAGKAYFKHKFKIDDFLKYLTEVLRITQKSEIAFLNKSILRRENFPLYGKVTQAELMQAVISNSPPVVMLLKGDKLKALLRKYLTGHSGLNVSGLKCKKNLCYVNGNKLNPKQHYRVATTLYLATGGGGYISAQKYKIKNKEDGIRDLLLSWLKKGGSAAVDGDFDINADKDFPDLQNLWVLATGTNLGFTAGKAGVYGRKNEYNEISALSKDDLYQLNADLSFYASFGNLADSFSVDSRILYGKTWTYDSDGAKTESEVADEIKLNLLYQWKRLKNINFHKQWWVPVPFVEFGGQTEFTPDVDTDGTNSNNERYKMLSGIVGSGVEPWEGRFFVKFGGGVKKEIDKEGFESAGTLYFGWNLINGYLFKIGKTSIKGESRMDSYIQNKTSVLTYEVKFTAKLYFLVTDQLYFNLTGESYSYKAEGTSWSTAFNVLFGINFSADTRIPFLYF